MLVLVTGAAGGVARFLVPGLRGRYRLRLHDRVPPDAVALPGDETVGADLLDFAAVERAVSGVDAIVHLAAQSRTTGTWEASRGPNLDGCYHVFEAARRAGVGKIVFASTNHVTGMYDREGAWPISPDQPVRPDSIYGVTKAFGEALGRYYADAFGMSVICLRIGWVLERPFDEQGLRMWLSPRDLCQIVHLSLASPVRFGLYYAVSDNRRNRWNLDNARRELGYAPVDDSEVFAAEILGPSHLTESRP